MNDIVEVTGRFEQTPCIRFVQKGKGVVSFTGEKLYETQVLAAVDEVLGSRGGSCEFIAAVGEMRGERPRYIFLVEFDGPLDDSQGKELAAGLDRALGTLNIEYEAKRDSRRLDPPVLRVVRQGEFDRYRKRMVEQGKMDGQFKILRLTTDQEFMREFHPERDIIAGSP